MLRVVAVARVQLYPQGKMSQVMQKMTLGDRLAFKGPRGKFQYRPNMKRAIGARPSSHSHHPRSSACTVT